MMKSLVDTHVLFWVLTQDKKKLTPEALQVISDAEMLLLPTIVLLELLGLFEKKQFPTIDSNINIQNTKISIGNRECEDKLDH